MKIVFLETALALAVVPNSFAAAPEMHKTAPQTANQSTKPELNAFENPVGITALPYDLQEIVISYLNHWQSHKLDGHTDFVFSTHFSPDGKYLVTGGKDKTIKIWDPHTQKIISTIHTGLVTEQQLTSQFKIALPHLRMTTVGAIHAVAISPDNRWVASSTSGCQGINIWDAQTQKHIGHLKTNCCVVICLAISPDGTKIAGSDDKKIKVWNVKTQTCQDTYTGHTNFVTGIEFDTTGDRIISCSKDTEIRVWDTVKKQVFKLKGHTEPIRSVLFSPCGTYAASTGVDKKIILWDIAKRKPKTTFTPLDTAHRIAISPCGKYLAAGLANDTVQIFDIKKEKQCFIMFIAAPATSVSFSPDGYLAIASQDKTVFLLHNLSIKLGLLLERAWQAEEQNQKLHDATTASISAFNKTGQ